MRLRACVRLSEHLVFVSSVIDQSYEEEDTCVMRIHAAYGALGIGAHRNTDRAQGGWG